MTEATRLRAAIRDRATAMFESNPLERQFRDLHSAAAHVMVGPMVYEAAGRVELGDAAEFPLC